MCKRQKWLAGKQVSCIWGCGVSIEQHVWASSSVGRPGWLAAQVGCWKSAGVARQVRVSDPLWLGRRGSQGLQGCLQGLQLRCDGQPCSSRRCNCCCCSERALS